MHIKKLVAEGKRLRNYFFEKIYWLYYNIIDDGFAFTGHKVAVVRQTETAAMRKGDSSKSSTFSRFLLLLCEHSCSCCMMSLL